MKLNSIQQQPLKSNTLNQNQNFKGSISGKIVDFVANHPSFIATTLAGSSVVAQKIVMSGSEATIGPAMDIGIGKAITKITDEKDGRTNQSSRTQALRTSAQAIGGTITGVIIRTACIAASTFALSKFGSKAGSKIGGLIAQGAKDKNNIYQMNEQYKAWGKNLGGAIAILVMMFTNFLIDAPFINKINKKMTEIADKKFPPKEQNEAKEVK